MAGRSMFWQAPALASSTSVMPWLAMSQLRWLKVLKKAENPLGVGTIAALAPRARIAKEVIAEKCMVF